MIEDLMIGDLMIRDQTTVDQTTGDSPSQTAPESRGTTSRIEGRRRGELGRPVDGSIMSTESELVDLLVVGGGPAGTAAAFRGCELGLKVLIIELDDLMKRIRDYSKDKLILPGFGGGDSMRFPKGGDLVSSLRFGPIDKDDMCAQWKGLYRQHGIAHRTGVELQGLERHPEGPYGATVYDHTRGTTERLWAQHVVLAIGRGVPRRFDIPGNTDGVAFHLKDPARYIGRPACVVGGGTSAAEAVISLSNAKAAVEDRTAVYWAYRGDKMPRVSKALASVFFEAYVGNGNIRYYPNSDPVAVVTAEDRQEYLAIRIDRRQIEGRPTETSQLEFPKECCIACIGEDIPADLLASLGAPMVVGGPRQRRRVVVNRYLETRQPNVYMVGDILSQAYFRTEDFDADPATFEEVQHRGNIKTALRDGVRVAQVIQQRLSGVAEPEIEVEDDPAVDQSFDISRAIPRPTATSSAPQRTVDVARVVDSAARLISLLPGGVQADEYSLPAEGVSTLGRKACDINFEHDTELSPQHASILQREGNFLLRDDGSATGVFLQAPSTRRLPLRHGDLLRLGRQFLLFSIAGGQHGFTHFNAQGQEISRHKLSEGTVVLGRKAPHFNLDRGDGTLSRRHISLTSQEDGLFLKDLKSANGSFLRVQGEHALEHGDRFRLGQQLLVFSNRENAVFDVETPRPAPVPASAAAVGTSHQVAPPDATLAEGLNVSFVGHAAFAASDGQTICDVAEANGLPINAECHAGICGSDPIRIISGHDNLDAEVSDGERETLEDICGLEAGDCRLACMVRFKGPVKVEIL